MRRFVPRTLLTALAVVSVAACASGGNAGVEFGGEVGGRSLVMIPDFQGSDGGDVANELRALITQMTTHAALRQSEVESAMADYALEELTEVTAQQLAQQIGVQMVSWGTVEESGAGLTADVEFIDTKSGDRIEVADATGATPVELAQSIFGTFQESVQGMQQASACTDYIASEEYESALDSCNAALAVVPSNMTALYGKATALLNLDRNQEALTTFQELLELDPTHQNGLLGAGLAAVHLGQRDVAMTFYNRYLELNPQNVQVRMTLANDIVQNGDYIAAYRLLEGGAADNADNTTYQQYLFAIATAAGQRAREQADSTEANDIFMGALEAFDAAYPAGSEPDAEAIRQAIAVHNALGHTDAAIALAKDATAKFPDEAQIWFQYGTVLNDAGRTQEAIDALTRVIQIDPSFENAHIRRAQAYLALGQQEQAIADFTAAAEAGQGTAAAQFLYAAANQAIQAQDFAAASPLFEAAYPYATGAIQDNIAFFWGYALFQQGVAIARDNAQTQDPAVAQRALEFFQQAVPHLQATSNSNAAQVLNAANQYIPNQQAIIANGG